jgi:tagatose-1,6-bisphosphate aldolase non-catalytic subunit AgaZ/GatZ
MYDKTCDAIKEHMDRLESYTEKYPDIALLVEVLSFPMLYGTDHEDQEKIYADACAQQLSQLMYHICKYSFYTSMTSRIQGDWVYELNSFIGNYLLDDFYFKLEQVGPNKLWQAKAASSGIQDAKQLVDAAKDNVEAFKQIDLKIAARQEIMRQLVIGDLS